MKKTSIFGAAVVAAASLAAPTDSRAQYQCPNGPCSTYSYVVAVSPAAYAYPYTVVSQVVATGYSLPPYATTYSYTLPVIGESYPVVSAPMPGAVLYRPGFRRHR